MRCGLHVPSILRFFELNPEFDLLHSDLLDPSAVASLRLDDVALADVLPELRARQRLLRVAGDAFCTDALAAAGYDSAHAIAAVPEEIFVGEWRNILPGRAEQAQAIHQKASTVKGQVLNLWATLHGTVAARQSSQLPSFNVSPALEGFFLGMPSYRDLFGPFGGCACEECKSILGAAAYFVDVMRIADRYITKVNEATIPTVPLDFHLSSRRPSLFTLPLTCEATNGLVPYLQIVNDVMATRLAAELPGPNVYQQLAVAHYPLNLPGNSAQDEIRLYVQTLRTSVAEIFATFAPQPPSAAIALATARERLSLSIEQYELATTASTDVAVLKARYGLAASQDLSVLDKVPTFLLQTALTREDLGVLLDQGLGAAERKVGIAHQFFFNQKLSGTDAIAIVQSGPESEQLTNLVPQSLDRINRFIRLSRWSGLAFADLDWLLASLGLTELDAASIEALANAVAAKQAFEIDADAAAALWSDMKTIGTGNGGEPQDLFDRIYNNVQVLDGAPPYRPLYARNPLYTDTVVHWKLATNETSSKSFTQARMAAALGLEQTKLAAMGEALFGAEATVALDVPNLSRLYRTVQIMAAVKLDMDEYVALLALIGLDITAVPVPADLLSILHAARELSEHQLAVGDLTYAVTGNAALSEAPTYQSATLYDAMKTIWVLSQPQLLTPTSFTADLLTEEQSAAAFKKIETKGGIFVLLRAAYEQVFDTVLETELALISRQVADEELTFLDPDFSKAEIHIIGQALRRAYNATNDLLDEQLAGLFETTSQIGAAIRYYFAQAIVLPDFIKLLATPVLLDDEAGSSWEAIEAALLAIARAVFVAELLSMKAAEIRSVADHPAVYALNTATLLDPSFDALRSVLVLHDLETLWKARPRDILAFLAMPTDTACTNGAKSAALSQLSGWPQAQICRVAQDLGGSTMLYDSLAGLARMQRCFAILAASGMDTIAVAAILRLRNLSAQTADWPVWSETVAMVAALSKARNESDWTAVSARVIAGLNERRRDLLLERLLWSLRQKDPHFVSARQLSDYLLIDVERSGCNDISLVVEGLNAVQLYLQRSRLNLEVGVEKISVPEAWWEWMLNYRVWEANRKIFLYPENYLIPSLRKSRTTLFRALQDSLQQSDLSPEQVSPAYKTYLDGVAARATLTCIDSCRYTVEDARRGAIDTLFLFARTLTEPYAYFYSRKEVSAGWSEWLPIDVSISSRYVSPVFAFNRLFLFWVELTPVSISQIKASSTPQLEAVSENEIVYRAAIRFTFYDFTMTWVPAQTVYEDEVVYVTPSPSTFKDSSGFRLFDMDSLYWRKVNVVHVLPDVLTTQPDNTAAAEKLTVFYGPFLDNNIDGIRIDPVPARPLAAQATANPPRYEFAADVRSAAINVNQALETRTRGPTALRNATTINADLNRDSILNMTEFPLLRQNLSPGVPPALAPKIDLPTSQLAVTSSFNVLRTNYDGDYTSVISSASLSRRVGVDAFIARGIDAIQSDTIFGDLESVGIVDSTGMVSSTFNRNTDLFFLFPGEPRSVAAPLIAAVQRILFDLRAAGVPANGGSFLLDPIDTARSKEVHEALAQKGILDGVGRVVPTLTSATDLSFLFPSIAEPQKGRLIDEVRRVLFVYLGDPPLLERIARENASVMMVKNQPGWFVFNNGNEAFLVTSDATELPPISRWMRIAAIESQPRVYEDTFVTPDIDLTVSKQIIADLKGLGIVGEDDRVEQFTPRTDLSSLLAGDPEPRRGIRIAEVRETLLGLPSITGFRYYYELEFELLDARSFIGSGIDEAQSAEVFAQLREKGIVDSTGLISRLVNDETDLAFLFPSANPSIRQALIAEVRRILLAHRTAAWQTTLYDLKFRFTRLSTASTGRLSRALFAGGIDSLLSLKLQQIPVVPEVPFSRYAPTSRVIAPVRFDGAQVDFDGPYGLYYWELFFYSPQLVAASLKSDMRFEEALRWYQYIFNPTLRPTPLTVDSFITPNIPRTLAQEAFGELRAKDIILADGSVSEKFTAGTDLSFLWPQLQPPEKEGRIREARNILLNNQVARPAARFWQFQPLRNHTVKSLIAALTDPVQIATYNNDPFDPFAIARLRIGAFEKSIFMGYVDTLIAWGDSLFTQFTWESLTAASLLYFYALDLLGPRPTGLEPCPVQPVTTFEKIKKAYESAPDGIPQFLIYVENLLPANDIVAPGLLGNPFTEIDPYFCVPENPQLLAYWDTLEDRLYKLRNCLDLEGRPRQLALFQPPINPLQLVRASAAGQSSLNVLQQQQATILPYRFTSLILFARQLTANVISFGASLAAALQSRDIEGLARLRARNEIDILNLTSESKKRQVDVMQATLDGLQENKKALDARRKFYNDLADEFLNPAEIANLVASAIALRFSVMAGTLQAAASIAYATPQVGSPFAMTYGGIQLGNTLNAAGQVAEVLGGVADFAASTSLTVGGYQRRAQEWRFNAEQAGMDAAALTKQIAAATGQLAIAQRDLQIHQRAITNAAKEQEFLTNKFDNQELYVWMTGRLSTLFFQTYRLALEAAMAVQAAYRYELDRDDTFINFDYWDSLHQGLLSKSLQLSLDQMESTYLRNNRRRLLIEKEVSLATIAPAELLRLKQTGECTLSLTEALFDFDFPGHYCRQIVAIALSVLDEKGEVFTTLNGMLTQTRNDVVLTADPKAVAYLLDPKGEIPSSIRRNWQAAQQIALYSGDSVTGVGLGLSSVNIYDERYIPFEGTGAVSEWHLSIPKATNTIDLMSISDVRIMLQYFALNGGTGARRDVEKLLGGYLLPAAIFLDLKQLVGADAWAAFAEAQPSGGFQTLVFTVDQPDLLPSNIAKALMMQIESQIVVDSGIKLPSKSEFISLRVDKAAVTQPLKMEGAYGTTTFSNGVPKDKFVGPWLLSVNVDAMAKQPELKALLRPDGRLDPDLFLDVQLFLVTKACVFGCG